MFRTVAFPRGLVPLDPVVLRPFIPRFASRMSGLLSALRADRTVFVPLAKQGAKNDTIHEVQGKLASLGKAHCE